MTTDRQILDRSALRFNQIGIIALSLLGFIGNEPLLPAFVAVVLLLGTLSPKLALFKQIYAHIAKPLGLMEPDPVEDVPASHEFAQLLGGIVLLAGTLFLFARWLGTGWTLTWVVILLATANVFFGFCAGCFLYYQLGKRDVPGFRPRPKTGGDYES
jgi:hypothetical protein